MRLLDRPIRYFRRLRSKFKRRGAQSLDLAKMHVFKPQMETSACLVCGQERSCAEHLRPDFTASSGTFRTGSFQGSLAALAAAILVIDWEAELCEEMGRFPFMVFVKLRDTALLGKVRKAAWNYKPAGVLMVVYGVGVLEFSLELQEELLHGL